MNKLPKESQLTDEQLKALHATPDKDQIILGVAGGGKTVIAIYRALALGSDNLIDKKKVLLLTFNDAINKFISSTVSKMDNNENVYVQKVYTYFKDLLNKYKPDDELKNISDYDYDVLLDAYNNQNDSELTGIRSSDDDRLIRESIKKAREDQPENALWNKKKMDKNDIDLELYNEIRWMEDNEISYVDGNNDKGENYLNINRIGRSSLDLGNKGGEQRKLVLDIYKDYHQQRDKFKNKSEARKIFNFNDVFRFVKYLDIPDSEKYDYIIIDEVQDITPAMFSALYYLRKKNDGKTTFTLLGDLSQNIYGSRVSWNKLGIRVDRSNSNRIRMNYRNTRQIAQFGKDVLDYFRRAYQSDVETDAYQENDTTFIEPEASNKDGKKPIAISSKQEDLILSFIKKSIEDKKTLLIITNGYRDRKDIKELLDKNDISSYTDKYTGIDDDKDILILPINKIKGLQFDNVLLYCVDTVAKRRSRKELVNSDGFSLNFNNLNDDDDDASIFYSKLYVSITRAENELMLVYRNDNCKKVLQDISNLSDGSLEFK